MQSSKAIIPVEKTIGRMKLRWIEFTPEQTTYLAQISFVNKEQSIRESNTIMTALRIVKMPEETYGDAWLRVMAQENKTTPQAMKGMILKEYEKMGKNRKAIPHIASLMNFYIIMR